MVPLVILNGTSDMVLLVFLQHGTSTLSERTCLSSLVTDCWYDIWWLCATVPVIREISLYGTTVLSARALFSLVAFLWWNTGWQYCGVFSIMLLLAWLLWDTNLSSRLVALLSQEVSSNIACTSKELKSSSSEFTVVVAFPIRYRNLIIQDSISVLYRFFSRIVEVCAYRVCSLLYLNSSWVYPAPQSSWVYLNLPRCTPSHHRGTSVYLRVPEAIFI